MMFFFTDPDFSGSAPDFRPTQIRTQKKSLIRIREKNPDPKHYNDVVSAVVMTISLDAALMMAILLDSQFWMIIDNTVEFNTVTKTMFDASLF